MNTLELFYVAGSILITTILAGRCWILQNSRDHYRWMVEHPETWLSRDDGGKPPLGLRPRYIAEHTRLIEIEEAIERYNQASLPVPEEWFAEHEELRRKTK